MERKEKKEMDGRMDGRTGRYHTCARTRRSGLPDGQRTNDCMLLRLPRASYPKKEIEKEGKRENRSRAARLSDCDVL